MKQWENQNRLDMRRKTATVGTLARHFSRETDAETFLTLCLYIWSLHWSEIHLDSSWILQNCLSAHPWPQPRRLSRSLFVATPNLPRMDWGVPEGRCKTQACKIICCQKQNLGNKTRSGRTLWNGITILKRKQLTVMTSLCLFLKLSKSLQCCSITQSDPEVKLPFDARQAITCSRVRNPPE